ncbi:MAG: MerR family transcriptional regulator [Polyangiaceae bacterium]
MSGTSGRGEAAYSIRLAARMSGVSEETLRVWERRYLWPRPERTESGARVYSGADIERLQWVKRALDRGYRPGAVMAKSSAELERLVSRAGPTARAIASVSDAPTVTAIVEAVRVGDSGRLDVLLRRAAMLLGIRRFVVEVAHPLCVEIGDLWGSGELRVHHEHLLTAALTVQLKTMVAQITLDRGAPAVLLTTFPGAAHGLGLELVAAYLASWSVAPVLLGVETPPDEIVLAARAHGTAVVGLSVVPPVDAPATANALDQLAVGMRRARLRTREIWIGGAAAREISRDRDAVELVDDWKKLDRAIERILD